MTIHQMKTTINKFEIGKLYRLKPAWRSDKWWCQEYISKHEWLLIFGSEVKPGNSYMLCIDVRAKTGNSIFLVHEKFVEIGEEFIEFPQENQ